MKTEIEDAIKALAKKASADNVEAHHAMNFAQAALNLAHALQVMEETRHSAVVARLIRSEDDHVGAGKTAEGRTRGPELGK